MNDKRRHVIFAWLDPGDPAGYREASAAPVRPDLISPLGFALDDNGRLLRPGRDSKGQLFNLRRLGAMIIPAVSDLDGRRGIAQAMLSHRKNIRSAVSSLCKLAVEPGVDGIALRFHGAFPDVRDGFAAFVEELAWELHQRERCLTVVARPQVRDPEVDQVPRLEDDPEGWLQALADSYDYRSLSAYADWFVIETAGYMRCPQVVSDIATGNVQLGCRPAPATPAGWLQSVIEHSLLHVPPRRLLITLPLYGRLWRQDPGIPSVVPMAELDNVLSGRSGYYQELDRASGDLRIQLVDREGRTQALLIDSPSSLAGKASLVARYDLGGIALFRLGYGTTAAWQELLAVLDSNSTFAERDEGVPPR